VIFTTGRGSVVGSAIAPVVKVCANPETYRRMPDDMDVDAGRILEGRSTIDDVAAELLDTIIATAAGRPTASEELGHREFVLTYKSSEPTGPSCLPTIRRR
jgi:altronate hydrolase